MDIDRNPFSPDRGHEPPELTGRDAALELVCLSFSSLGNNLPAKTVLITGTATIGKTALLKRIATEAGEQMFAPVFIPINPSSSLLDSISQSLDGGLPVRRNTDSQFLDINRTWDLEAALTYLVHLTEDHPSAAPNKAVVVMDDLHLLPEQELTSLLMMAHSLSQKLPFLLIGAGRPQLLEATSQLAFAKHLFTHLEISALSPDAVQNALQKPAISAGVRFTRAAIDEIFRVSTGNPHLLQQIAFLCWNQSQISPIDIDSVLTATKFLISRSKSSFLMSLTELSPIEKKYLRALANLDSGHQLSSRVSSLMGLRSDRGVQIRRSLIKKGLIFNPAYGYTAFITPLFGEFIKTSMPHPQPAKPNLLDKLKALSFSSASNDLVKT